MSKIFISYSSKDFNFVKKLAIDLLTNDIPIWLDKHEIFLGDSFKEKINGIIGNNNFNIVVLSKNYKKSYWTSKEFKTILTKEVNDKKKYLIPIKIDDSKIPPSIKERIYQSFDEDYDKSVRELVRFFKKENYSIRLIPLSERQIILNFSNAIELDVELIKSILIDRHLLQSEKINKSQIIFNSYEDIDRALELSKNNLLDIANNKAITIQYHEHRKKIEVYIDNLISGIVTIINTYNNHDVFHLSISIEWLSRIFMVTIYNLIACYMTPEQLIEYNLNDKIFSRASVSPLNSAYNSDGKAYLDVFEKNNPDNGFSINVDEKCYAYRELNKFHTPLSFSEVYEPELLYKYAIPQNVFKNAISPEKNPLLIIDIEKYMVGPH